MKLINWLLAYFRLSETQICEQSKGRGEYDDYHDYPDDVENWDYPPFFHQMTCKRCGKKFRC